jgi:hypothetical protein
MKISKKDKERFWSKVNVGGPDDCWEWSGYKDKARGYGQFYFQNIMWRCHRFSFLLHFGSIPNGPVIKHTCNNPSCVNPDHLYSSDRGSKGTVVDRFWRYVIKGAPETCWEWVGRIHEGGYGHFTANKGKQWQAHRFSWVLVNGEIPSGMFICHKCDNRKCVNPEHLFLGTHNDNMQDMINKGRQNKVFGESHCRAILTKENVVAIRQSKESYKILAEKYSVSCSTIVLAANGTNWKDVKTPIRRERLIEQQVREIRQLNAQGASRKDLMQQYGICARLLWRVINRKTWKHVK